MYTPKALNLLRNKLIDGKSLISHCFSLDRIKEAMAVAAKDKERAVKVVVRC
jgi:threonine dehydrogenase-like Zn-dependent dehydrogenase